MNSLMKILPIDDVPVFCPTWEEIEGKAHMYKTARIRATGEYVRIHLGMFLGTPMFLCYASEKVRRGLKTTEELCGFVL